MEEGTRGEEIHSKGRPSPATDANGGTRISPRYECAVYRIHLKKGAKS